jgi:ferredoxin
VCEAEAADLFEVRNNGSLVILNDRPGEDRYDAAEAAMVACPTGALTGVED